MTSLDFATVLKDARRSGIYNLPASGAAPIVNAAIEAGFVVFHVSLAGVHDKDGLLAALARTLRFPEWFGGNWDSLHDCLTDLSWCEAEGYVVLLEECAGFVARAQQDFVVAADIFNTAAAVWRDDGVPFWVFADLHPNGLALLPSLT